MKTLIFIICFFMSLFAVAKNEDDLPKLNSFIDEALESNSVNKHIVAGLISKSYDLSYKNEQLYKKALKLDPSNILLLEQLVQHCHNEDGESFCNQEKYLKKLQGLDSNNGLPFLLASLYYSKKGNSSKALKLLKIGASKNNFDAYNWKNFELTRKELSRTKFPQDEVLVVAVKNAQVGDFATNVLAEAMNLCVDKSKENNSWKNTCIDYGELMEIHSNMMLSTFVGFAIQREIYKNQEQDSVYLEKVLHRRDVFHQFRLRVVESLSWASMLGFENEVPNIFWKELLHYGERVAYQKALDRSSAKGNDN
ncbi:type IV pilus biogenesis/stability protein PilW [Marinicella sp. W31]|uniref:tetratricopeptide repeat protein n=1 Tax=Marinicella sp. W31 TaxID=3023713 RepID=UPI00375792AE